MDYYSKWLVETSWLAQHLEAPDIVIFDCTLFLAVEKRDAQAEYLEEHIPGALRFDIDEIADTNSSLPHMLPSPEKFSSRVRKMGIGDGTRIVCYDTQNMYSASRAWWMFRVMGHDDVVILNGGLMKWDAEQRPLASGEPMRRTERHFTPRRNSGLVRDLDDVKHILSNHSMQIVDARNEPRFKGAAPEPREAKRLGHIPGSKNLPFSQLVTPEHTLKQPAEIRAVFEAAGVDIMKPVVATCGSGVTACMVALGLAVLGHEQTSVYDGSWAEWNEQADLPVEQG